VIWQRAMRAWLHSVWAWLFWIAGTPEKYGRLWKERFCGSLRGGIVNRYALEKLGNHGYSRFSCTA